MNRVPFYLSAERQAAFVSEARSWIGTPFRENCSIKGPAGGIDCVRFALAVHVACGAVQPVDIEVLPVEFVRSWHVHQTRSRVLDFFHQPEVRKRIRRLDEDETPMIGDMVALRQENCVHHLALFCGPEVLHVSVNGGVLSHSSRNPEMKKLVAAFYRIFEP